MNKKIQLLISLYDLDIMIKELSQTNTLEKMKEIGFKIEFPSRDIQRVRMSLVRRVGKEVYRHYKILMERYGDRPVVPVISGYCGGCFMQVPTQLMTKKNEIVKCPNCGRFLYWVDDVKE